MARRCRGAAWVTGFAAALVALSVSGESRAQVNAGLEGGMAIRSGSPGLNPGLAWGAHLGVKPISMLTVSAYYLGYDMSVDGYPSTAHKAGFDTFGGKVRLTLPLPGSDLRPFAYAGLGRVGATYPVETVALDVNTNSGIPSGLLPRDGHFLEVPLGLGLGYKTAKIFELSIDFAIRPAFGFAGDAYKGAMPFDETKLGFTGMLGFALDL